MKEKIVVAIFAIVLAFSGLVGFSTAVNAGNTTDTSFQFYNTNDIGYTEGRNKENSTKVYIHPRCCRTVLDGRIGLVVTSYITEIKQVLQTMFMRMVRHRLDFVWREHRLLTNTHMVYGVQTQPRIIQFTINGLCGIF